MSDDNKNEQSIMIPLDELLAQDPSLGAHLTPQSQSNVDHKKLDKVGLTRDTHHAAAPLNNVVVPMRRTEMHTKKRPSKLLSALSILIGVAALIAVGVFIGGVINQQNQTKTLSTTPAPKANKGQPQNPRPSISPKMAPAIAVNQAPQEPKPAVAPIAQEAPAPQVTAKTPTKRKRRKSKAKRASKPAPKPQPKAVAAPEPPPQPKAQPKPAPKPSEAASLLSGLKSSKRNSVGGVSNAGAQDQARSDLPPKLERSQILSVLRKNRRSVTRCTAHITEKTRVKMRLVIAGSGTVSNATLHEPAELKNSPLAQCMIERVKLFAFPAFGAKSMAVKLPFILQKK